MLTNRVVTGELPDRAEPGVVLTIRTAKQRNRYWERTDRNIGWITRKEQALLRQSTIAIAGCGGMGGWIAEMALRLGIGEIRIADPELFDFSNLGRQAGATQATIGTSKAMATAARLRSIAADTTIVVYADGITTATVDHFLDGVDLVFDMIEFFALPARVLLHRRMREKNIPMLLNFNSVGHRSYGFKYTPQSMPIEEALGLGEAEVLALGEAAVGGGSDAVRARKRIIRAIMQAFGPELPEYGIGSYLTREAVHKRLERGIASIISPNPLMAAGFALNRGMVELLYARSPIARRFAILPPMPGFVSFDAVLMCTNIHTGVWWQ